MSTTPARLWTRPGVISRDLRRQVVKWGLVASVLVWAGDTGYKLFKDISYVNREQCVLFRSLPRPGFLVFEYFIETIVITFVGIFIAVWLSRQFLRYRRLFPRNPLTAFAYGSTLPVCSCGVIPLVTSMRGRLGFTTLMALVISAPILSPYIIVLSFTVLGPVYGLLRIGSALVLTMTTAGVLGLVYRERDLPAVAAAAGCSKQCAPGDEDIYLETLAIFRRLLPYLAVAGALGVALEYLGPRQFLLRGGFAEGLPELAIWTLVGVPLYFCNGAEVLFLRPLVNHGFPLGTAISFSLTSTSVCVTSIAMLLKVIGTRLTVVMVAWVTAVSFALALLINLLV